MKTIQNTKYDVLWMKRNVFQRRNFFLVQTNNCTFLIVKKTEHLSNENHFKFRIILGKLCMQNTSLSYRMKAGLNFVFVKRGIYVMPPNSFSSLCPWKRFSFFKGLCWHTATLLPACYSYNIIFYTIVFALWLDWTFFYDIDKNQEIFVYVQTISSDWLSFLFADITHV